MGIIAGDGKRKITECQKLMLTSLETQHTQEVLNMSQSKKRSGTSMSDLKPVEGVGMIVNTAVTVRDDLLGNIIVRFTEKGIAIWIPGFTQTDGEIIETKVLEKA